MENAKRIDLFKLGVNSKRYKSFDNPQRKNTKLYHKIKSSLNFIELLFIYVFINLEVNLKV